MNKRNNTLNIFFELVRAGLWEKDVQLSSYDTVDYQVVFRIAEEQSVIGLVAAGIDHVRDVRVPQEVALQFVGSALQLEKRNQAMNVYVGKLIESLRRQDVYAILVKGQGIAQCYENPLWRAAGDVDLLLSDVNYEKAKKLLIPIASEVGIEEKYGKHIGLEINSFAVELHGTQHCELSRRMDSVIDEVQNDVFCGGNVRSWDCDGTTIFLPSPNNDVIFIFTHFLKHFFKEGVGLKQICDWCRLLYSYNVEIDIKLLEERLNRMRLISEWKAFAALAVEYLGIPSNKMPLYDSSNKWVGKASRICDYIIEVGNMGQNRDLSYFGKYPYFIRKVISFFRRSGYLFSTMRLFPWDSIRFMPGFVYNGVRSALRGE